LINLRKPKDYILLYFKGISMGAAEVVPGVSGGSVAFITGIYDELLHALRAIDREALQLLKRRRFADFWRKINGSFLVAVFSGVATSLLTLARLMVYLLKQHPILVWSFFFGLIIISAPLMLREIKHWSLLLVITFFLGAGLAYLVTILSPTQTPDGIWFIFVAGALAVTSLILPGISGVFILLLIEKYQYMINALINLNIPVVLVYMAGCTVGLLGFSRFLVWVLDNYRSTTVALLAGMMLGSLNKVWPWRQVLEYVTNSKGEQVPAFDKSILPWHYFATTGKNPQVFQAILMIALGVFIVVLIEKISVRLKTKI
jgi:putative membrane protein